MSFFYKVNTDINGADNWNPNLPQGAGYAVGTNTAGTYGNWITGLDFKTDTSYVPAIFITNNRGYSTGLSSSTVGLICGGYNGDANVNSDDIDGIQFSTETMIPISNTIKFDERRQGAGINAPDRGWIWSGYWTNSIMTSATTVNFSTYAKNTHSAMAQVARTFCSGVSNETHGYAMGGLASGTTVSNEIDGVIFSSITSVNPAATLASARHGGVTVDNAVTGFYLGGSSTTTAGGGASNIYGFIIGTTSSFSIGSTLSTLRTYAAGVSGSTAGYMMGGYNTGSSTLPSASKFNLLTYVVTSATISLTKAHANSAGVYTRQFHNMYGRSYVGGGLTGVVYSNTIECIEYSNTPTTRTTNVSLTNHRGGVRGISSAKTGFYCGGTINGSTGLNYIDGIHYSTEMQKTTSATLAVGRLAPSTFESYARGYIYAGRSTSTLTSIDTFIFETETRQTISATAGQAMYYGAGFSARGNAYGWILGGATNSNSPFSAIYGLNLATETSSISSGSLLQTNYSGTAVGSASYTNAYFTGGWNGSSVASGIYSFNHKSTSGSVTVGTTAYSLTTPRYDATGSSSNTEGYISGGYNGSTKFSSIEKLNFSSGGASSVTGMYLITGKTNAAAVGTPTLHQNYNLAGYLVGGYDYGPTYFSNTVDAYDFASEALYNQLTFSGGGVAGQGACSSVTTGYLGGGNQNTSSTINRIDKFNYSTKIYSVAFATLNDGARRSCDGVNSSIKGYFGGGSNGPATTVYAYIDGVVFSTELVFNPASSLSNSRSGSTGNNSLTEGYWMGGTTTGTGTRTRSCEKITFSTETTVNTSNVLPSARANLAGTNSSTKAYYFGGNSALNTAHSTSYKMTFPTLSAFTMGSTLSRTKRVCKGFGNEISGYIAGGSNAALTVSYKEIEQCIYSTEVISLRDAVLTRETGQIGALSAI